MYKDNISLDFCSDLQNIHNVNIALIMDDDIETGSQTSTVYTHPSRIFSLEDDITDSDVLGVLDIKLESSQSSPRSPSLLQPEREKIHTNNDLARQNIHVNSMAATRNSESYEFHSNNCIVTSDNEESDFNYNEPEATWKEAQAFINLSIPWISRNESEQKRCVAFFGDLINKATNGSPISLILPLILQLPREE